MPEASKTLSMKGLFSTVKPNFRLTKLLSIGFGLILISWLLSQLDFREAAEIIRDVPPSLLAAGFGCYGLSFYLRAVRFRILLPDDQPKQRLFSIVLVHYTALNIIPARLGELSYVYLLKKVNGISTGHSVSSLLLARVCDQVAISLLYFSSSLFVEFPSQWLKTVHLAVAGILGSILLMFIAIGLYKERCMHWLHTLSVSFRWQHVKRVQRIFSTLEDIAEALTAAQIRRHAVPVLGLSLLIWLGIFTVNYTLLRAFGVSLSYIEVLLSSTFIILLGLLPIHVTSGVGLHETTWVVIALALGVPRNIAITAAFGTHLVSILYLFGFGAYGFLSCRQIFFSASPSEASPGNDSSGKESLS